MRSDAELIVASQDDPRAFRELYDRWAETLLGYFYRRVSDAEVAADLLAETFAVAYEGSLKPFPRASAGRAAPGCTGSPAASSPTTSGAVASSCERCNGWGSRGYTQIDAESSAAIDALEASAPATRHKPDGRDRPVVGQRTRCRAPAGDRRARLRRDRSPELRCSEAAARTRVHRGLAHLSELMEAHP